ncbi:Putative serine/threonine-protein kinase pknH [Minicystis rosea]|nr:Putative serine/threonine-protein kinase pknH [Minicystis rosea]
MDLLRREDAKEPTRIPFRSIETSARSRSNAIEMVDPRPIASYRSRTLSAFCYSRPVGSAPLLEAGAVFAEDYRVVRLLSEGAQGAVYAVEQLSTKRPRALKLMLPELVERAEMRRRFDIEARVGARIESDHIVEVIASGIDATTGAPWIAMELLDGVELGEHVTEKGPIARTDVREILGQLCHALGAAHRAAIVHRDLKPENVILARPRQRGAKYMVKVIDFGVARMVAEAAQTANATQSILGTPLWMAPEQVTPGAPIRPAADVWSLGLIAYYLLTGRAYWLTAYDPEASVWRILNEVCVTAMPSASARAQEQGAEELLPEGFDAWFSRCVDRDQDKRFADATIAFEALEKLLPAPPPRTSSPSFRGSDPGMRSSDAGVRIVEAGAAPPAPANAPRPLAASPATAAAIAPRPPVASVATPQRPRFAWAVMGIAALGTLAALLWRLLH